MTSGCAERRGSYEDEKKKHNTNVPVRSDHITACPVVVNDKTINLGFF